MAITDEDRARRHLGRGHNLAARLQLAERPGHRGGVQHPLGHLDPLVERFLGVAGKDGHRLLGEDGSTSPPVSGRSPRQGRKSAGVLPLGLARVERA